METELNKHIKIFKKTREIIYSFIDKFNENELNVIPKNYNNNLMWNLGHIMVTHQVLIYKLSKLEPNYKPEYFDMFRKGTKPDVNKPFSNEIIKDIKNLFMNNISKLESDINNKIFKEFSPYTTHYGFELNTFEDAIIFNNIHENIHLGYILSQSKLVK